VRAWSLAIGLSVFFVYMLAGSREPAWGDAHPMWEVAERMVQDGAIDIKTRWPDDMPPGRDGKTYGITPIGPNLMHVPGAAIAGLAHGASPAHDTLVRPLATHLAPALLGALACILFFGLLVDLGRTRRTASLCTALLAVATTLFVYARMPYSEVLQLTCFLGLFRATLRLCAEPVRRSALWWGAWAGLLLNSKYVYALAIAGAALLVGWTLRARRREILRVAVWAAVTGVPFVVLALVYNYLRWSDVTKSGYEPYLSWYFGGSVFDGTWGLLLSPNKSAFLYSPALVLAVLGWPRAIRSTPRLGLAVLVILVPTFVVYTTYRTWSGDYSWGPRFFVWTIPVLLVGVAWFVDDLVPRWKRGLVIATLAAGLAVNILGSSLYWDHFIRIAIDVKNQWLGQPNRRGAYIPERGRGHCDSCFEDSYEYLWLPAFQPIKGHLWLLRSLARGDAADGKDAQLDAPWRRYTSLPVNLAASYPRARIDWWGLLWLRDAPRTWALGLVLCALFSAGAAFGIWRWIRLHRSGIQSPDAEGGT